MGNSFRSTTSSIKILDDQITVSKVMLQSPKFHMMLVRANGESTGTITYVSSFCTPDQCWYKEGKHFYF